jgi:dTDP-glucose 4,6-dehydratase
MKYLVTGGLGFIGSNFIKSISSNDSQILNIDKNTYASNDPKHCQKNLSNISNVHFCLSDQVKTIKTIIDFNPDIIVNFAAESHVDRSIESPQSFIESNIISTFNLLESFRALLKKKNNNLKKMIHISTDEVYGSLKKSDPAFTENSLISPSSPYAASKSSSDLLVKSWFKTYGIPVIITNCSNNYGPFQNPEKLIPNIIYRIIKNLPIEIYGDGKNVRDWIYVEDHVNAIKEVIRKGKVGETYNIGGECELSNNEIAKILIDKTSQALGLDANKIISNLTYVTDRPGHDFRYAMNISKIRSKIGWSPKYNFEGGIDRTIEWYINYFNSDWYDKKSDFKRIGVIN